MRKFGLIAAIAGFGILAVDLMLRMLADRGFWLWLPGFLLLAGGSLMVLWAQRRAVTVAPGAPGAPKARADRAGESMQLLDNFEQRFAELKSRNPNAAVLGELYDLAFQLERSGRTPQATAVYRYLARIDNTYRDVADRLRRLLDTAGRAPPASSDAAPDGAATASPGFQQLGRYRLEREIGRGAMGIVYLGRDTAINRLVAVKVIPLGTNCSEAELQDARTRFFREAETAGRLNHPNIVTIYDVGEERNLAYIAMEYLAGHHLSDFSTSSGLLDPGKVLELIARTAEALGFAHKQHVVHRDIKPANLMYDEAADSLKITDFGIARLTSVASTRTGIVLGTPSFMSPEQLEGRTVTGRSDLFSLGVSLFQLLTGQLPFAADSMTGLMQQIAEAPHPSLRAFRPDLPACVERVIDRALAKNPDDRFDSGAQMAAALEDCRSRIASGVP